MTESKEWIVRFYANHDSIPEGHHDGEIVRELIRCKDCKHSATGNYFNGIMCGKHRNERGMLFISVEENGYCAWAKRKTDSSDRPVTCDYCKYWHFLKRDGRYWCTKHSTYMDGCEEGER